MWRLADDERDTVLDERGRVRRPAVPFDHLVSLETYGEGSGIGRVVGLVIADAVGYRRLSGDQGVFVSDLWGYEILDTGGERWFRVAFDLVPLMAPGKFDDWEDNYERSLSHFRPEPEAGGTGQIQLGGG